MNDILREVTNPVWWFSVIVAGILVNIFSGYVKQAADKQLARYSETKKYKLKQKDEERRAQIAILVNDGDEMYRAHFREIRTKLSAITMLLMATALLALAVLAEVAPIYTLEMPITERVVLPLLAAFVALVCILVGMRFDKSATEIQLQIRDALKQTGTSDTDAKR